MHMLQLQNVKREVTNKIPIDTLKITKDELDTGEVENNGENEDNNKNENIDSTDINNLAVL